MPRWRAIPAGPRLGLEGTNLGRFDGWAPPLVDAGGLGFGDALHLSLAAQVGLKLGEHARAFRGSLAGSGAGVDRLFGRLQDGAPCFERPDDVLEVSYGAG